jgi:hypothetical protein
LLAAGLGAAAAGAQEVLTLRLSDAVGEPGGEVAVVLRTYAPRPVGQGQIDVRPRRPAKLLALAGGLDKAGADNPFAQFLGGEVFGADGTPAITFDASTQLTQATFASALASINAQDGPLAVLRYQLDPGVMAGDKYDLEIGPDTVFLLDENGVEIPLRLKGGTLRIVAPDTPRQVAADAGAFPAGATAIFGLETQAVFAIGHGDVVLTYEPAIAAGAPTIVIDPRYGQATVLSAVENPPGTLHVTFDSDGTLNSVPGLLVAVHLPLRTDLTPGTISPVTIEPATQLLDPAAQPIPLAIEAGQIEILPPDPLLIDPFESGLLRRWSRRSPL